MLDNPIQRAWTEPGLFGKNNQRKSHQNMGTQINLKSPPSRLNLDRTTQQRVKNINNAKKALMKKGDGQTMPLGEPNEEVSIVFQKFLSPRSSWMKIQQSGRGSLAASSKTRKITSPI